MTPIRTLVGILAIFPIVPALAQSPSIPRIPTVPSIPTAPALPGNLNPSIPTAPALPGNLNPSIPTAPALPGNLNPSDHDHSGDLPDDPTQMRSWICTTENERIAVSAKEVKGWKDLIEKQGWRCSEGNADIPDRTLRLSCEPEQTLGILSVYWLEGKNGNNRLTGWKDTLAKQQGMACSLHNVQFFDTQNNLIPNLNR